MSTNQRLTVVPTVSVLGVIKARLVGATRGHSLLKKKADALTMEFRKLLRKIYNAKQKMGGTMKDSAFALTEAKYAAGEKIKNTILDNVDQADVKVRPGQGGGPFPPSARAPGPGNGALLLRGVGGLHSSSAIPPYAGLFQQ